MNELILGQDEAIILESDDVTWLGADRIRLDRMTLTNKSIYLAYKEKNGLFAKAIDQVIQRPLSEIKVIDGRPMIDQAKKGDYGVCLQIQFLQGREMFAFESKKKKNVANWLSELYRTLTGEELPVQEKEKSGGLSGLKASIKNATETVSSVAGSAAGTVTQMAKQAKNSASASFETAKESLNNKTETQPVVAQADNQQSGPAFCTSCGKPLEPGAQFCSGCGTPVGNMAAPPVPAQPVAPPPVPTPSIMPVENPTTRQQEFAGVVLKCPNCGAPISQTTAICPECGYHITGQAAVSSVKAFNDQLMAIEQTRKTSKLGILSVYAPASAADKQKLSLIRSFPIPNTIDDIQEFMMLAVTNIDVGVSKKSWRNQSSKMEVLAIEMPKVISDAWVSKMQQAYEKAKIMFPNEPVFKHIKQLYVDKMNELKIKIKD